MEIRASPLNAELLSDHRARAVATHHVFCCQNLLPATLSFGYRETDTLVVLLNGVGRPAKETGDIGEIGHPPAEYFLGQILGQTLVGLEIV